MIYNVYPTLFVCSIVLKCINIPVAKLDSHYKCIDIPVEDGYSCCIDIPVAVWTTRRAGHRYGHLRSAHPPVLAPPISTSMNIHPQARDGWQPLRKNPSMPAEKYRIGEIGVPWGDKEKAEWLNQTTVKRSYLDEVRSRDKPQHTPFLPP